MKNNTINREECGQLMVVSKLIFFPYSSFFIVKYKYLKNIHIIMTQPKLEDIKEHEPKMKRCSHCKQWKSINEFHKSKHTKDGLQCYCKDCNREIKGQKKREITYKIINGITYKRCSKCKEWKPITEFCKHKSHKDGLQDYCKDCKKDWYENNKEHVKEYEKQWYENNKERAKQYYESNREYIKKYSKEYKENHKELIWAIRTYNTHKQKGFKMIITENELKTKLINTPYCPLCGCKLEYGDGKAQDNSPTLDRIDNETTLTNDNTWIICHKCNRTKGNRTLKEFIDYCTDVIFRYYFE